MRGSVKIRTIQLESKYSDQMVQQLVQSHFTVLVLLVLIKVTVTLRVN